MSVSTRGLWVLPEGRLATECRLVPGTATTSTVLVGCTACPAHGDPYVCIVTYTAYGHFMVGGGKVDYIYGYSDLNPSHPCTMDEPVVTYSSIKFSEARDILIAAAEAGAAMLDGGNIYNKGVPTGHGGDWGTASGVYSAGTAAWQTWMCTVACDGTAVPADSNMLVCDSSNVYDLYFDLVTEVTGGGSGSASFSMVEETGKPTHMALHVYAGATYTYVRSLCTEHSPGTPTVLMDSTLDAVTVTHSNEAGYGEVLHEDSGSLVSGEFGRTAMVYAPTVTDLGAIAYSTVAVTDSNRNAVGTCSMASEALGGQWTTAGGTQGVILLGSTFTSAGLFGSAFSGVLCNPPGTYTDFALADEKYAPEDLGGTLSILYEGYGPPPTGMQEGSYLLFDPYTYTEFPPVTVSMSGIHATMASTHKFTCELPAGLVTKKENWLTAFCFTGPTCGLYGKMLKTDLLYQYHENESLKGWLDGETASKIPSPGFDEDSTESSPYRGDIFSPARNGSIGAYTLDTARELTVAVASNAMDDYGEEVITELNWDAVTPFGYKAYTTLYGAKSSYLMIIAHDFDYYSAPLPGDWAALVDAEFDNMALPAGILVVYDGIRESFAKSAGTASVTGATLCGMPFPSTVTISPGTPYASNETSPFAAMSATLAGCGYGSMADDSDPYVRSAYPYAATVSMAPARMSPPFTLTGSSFLDAVRDGSQDGARHTEAEGWATYSYSGPSYKPLHADWGRLLITDSLGMLAYDGATATVSYALSGGTERVNPSGDFNSTCTGTGTATVWAYIGQSRKEDPGQGGWSILADVPVSETVRVGEGSFKYCCERIATESPGRKACYWCGSSATFDGTLMVTMLPEGLR